MQERPILMTGEMVRATLDGRKTQTRRVVKPWQLPKKQDDGSWFAVAQRDRRWGFGVSGDTEEACARELSEFAPCPYGRPGDRLWVREAHAFVPEPAYRCSTGIYQQINPADDYEACVYRENFDRARSFPWRPSIHMPRWASRITLEIVSVRVERLQAISEADALAEGVAGEQEAAEAGLSWHDKPRRAFRFLWQSINGADSWDANPWVWVVEFKRVEPGRAAA